MAGVGASAAQRGDHSGVLFALAGLACGVGVGALLERYRQRRAAAAAPRPASSTDVVRSGAEVVVDRAALEALVAGCVERCGAAPADAALVAEVLVAADCRGVPSHGVNRAEMYCGEMEAGLIDVAARPRVANETESCACVDGCNALGAVVSKFAMELCLRKAEATGVGVVVCRGSNHFGIAGYWAEMALRKKLIGFAFTNTSPFMVPTRAFERAGGTNPIACYCPAGLDSFQLDMATTTVPVGKVEVCHRKGQPIPLGWGVDRTGTRSTTDAAEVLLGGGGLTPLGGLEETAGYKGYGLNMMVEILTAVLSGCEAVGPDVLPWRVDRAGPVDYGHCFVCMDPCRLLPDGSFEGRLSAYLERMRGLAPGDAAVSVLVPGDPERAQECLARQQGVRLNCSIAAGLRALARRLGCEARIPGPIGALPEDMAVPRHAGAAAVAPSGSV